MKKILSFCLCLIAIINLSAQEYKITVEEVTDIEEETKKLQSRQAQRNFDDYFSDAFLPPEVDKRKRSSMVVSPFGIKASAKEIDIDKFFTKNKIEFKKNEGTSPEGYHVISWYAKDFNYNKIDYESILIFLNKDKYNRLVTLECAFKNEEDYKNEADIIKNKFLFSTKYNVYYGKVNEKYYGVLYFDEITLSDGFKLISYHYWKDYRGSMAD